MEKILKRSEQDASNCWSVTDLFPGDEAWSAELEACQKLPEQLGAYPLAVGDGGEAHVRVVEAVENVAGAPAHLAGGGQQVLLGGGEDGHGPGRAPYVRHLRQHAPRG